MYSEPCCYFSTISGDCIKSKTRLVTFKTNFNEIKKIKFTVRMCFINHSRKVSEIFNTCHTSKMERFAKIVNDFQPLTFFHKRSTLDV